MLERNEKGFTLIEIIVSTAIGVVVLGVVLSMILTAFDTFGTFSTTGLKKESLDNLVEYVRDEVMNATEVVMSDNTPNPTDSKDWHWLAVMNGQLYYGDNNKNTSGRLVVNSSYYKQKSSYDRYQQNSQMTWSGTCSQTKKNDNYVFIVNFSYKLSYKGTSYSKNDAINFSNVKYAEDSDIKNSGDIRLLSKNNTTKKLDDNSMKLWYRKVSKSASSNDNDNNDNNNSDNTDPNASNPNLTHTVADKIYLMSSYSNRGYFTGTCESIQNDDMFTLPMYNDFRAGDYVYYEGYWWMAVKNLDYKEITYKLPGTGARCWQRLSEDFSDTSVYFKGDIIKYNGGYYQRQISEVTNNDSNPPQPYNTDNYPDAPYKNSSSTWKYIGTTVDDTTPGFDLDYTEVENGKLSTVMKYQAPNSSPINDPARTSLGKYAFQGENIPYTNAYVYATDFPTVEEYNNAKKYQIGDLVKVLVNKSDGGRGSQYNYYHLYKKISEPEMNANDNQKVPGSSFKSGWELLENEYSPSSSYEAGKEMRIGNNDLDTAVKGTAIDYIKLNAVSGSTKYTDTNGVKQVYNLNKLKTICSDEASIYFGLKYGYIKSATKNGDNITVNYYNDWSGKSSESWLDRGMIYYNSRKGSDSDDVSYNDGQVQGTTQNSNVRKELWTELTYNDIASQG